MSAPPQSSPVTPAPGPATIVPPVLPSPTPGTHLSELERQAFTQGYEEGERVGREAGDRQAEGRLRRIVETLDELGTLRQQMIQQTERQVVQLALTIAKRILGREVSLDPELMVALVRVALDRLGERAGVTVRLHPDDCAIATAPGHEWAGDVTVVSDASVSRGGCRIESELGVVDASIAAQFAEIEQAILAEETAAVLVPETQL